MLVKVKPLRVTRNGNGGYGLRLRCTVLVLSTVPLITVHGKRKDTLFPLTRSSQYRMSYVLCANCQPFESNGLTFSTTQQSTRAIDFRRVTTKKPRRSRAKRSRHVTLTEWVVGEKHKIARSNYSSSISTFWILLVVVIESHELWIITSSRCFAFLRIFDPWNAVSPSSLRTGCYEDYYHDRDSHQHGSNQYSLLYHMRAVD